MKNCLTIIDSFIHTDIVERKLDDCLTKLKQRNHDIMLISNTIANPKILQKVDFYFYDKRNQLFESTYDNYTKINLWRQFDNFIVHDITPGMQRHGLSVLINLFNAIHFAHSLGYEFFQRLEVDDLMGSKSLDFVDSVPKLCSDLDSLGLFYFNERENKKESDVSFHYFYCNISYFLEKVIRIYNEETYRLFLRAYHGIKDFISVERYLYENFSMRGSSKLLKKSGTEDINKDFPDTIWNSETTSSNVESKYDGCVTKLYNKRINSSYNVVGTMILFSYNYSSSEKKRVIVVEHEDGSIDNILHKLTEASQWYYSVLTNVKKISVFESNKFLYEEVNKGIESYIDFL